jgi:ribonuclease P protein component
VKESVSVKQNHEFRRLYSRGRSAVTPYLVVYCRPNKRENNRLGVTVSAKLGGAVVRNRVRRRLREVFRLAQPKMKQGYDVILVGRGRAIGAPYGKLTAAFEKAAGQLGLLNKP